MSDVKAKSTGNLGLLLDYGPLIAFFAGFKIWGVFVGTGVFMAAMIVAVIVSKLKLGRISPLLGLSAILIVGFGALTIWFHDPRFIQLKPTIIYAGLGALLLGGVMLGRPLLKYVLEAGFEGLGARARGSFCRATGACSLSQWRCSTKFLSASLALIHGWRSKCGR